MNKYHWERIILREKCPHMELFLTCIFSANGSKVIYTLFTHCKSFIKNRWLENVWEKTPTIAFIFCILKKKNKWNSIKVIFISSIAFTVLDQKIRLMKKYVKIKISVKLQCPQKRIIYQNLISIWSQTKCRILFMLILILLLKHIWMCK